MFSCMKEIFYVLNHCLLYLRATGNQAYKQNNFVSIIIQKLNKNIEN